MAAEPAAPLNMAMKLLVDTKAGRVLYAEASKDVIDFLFSLLALPLGSVGNLHRSVATLDTGHVCRRGATDALLEPAVLHLTIAAPAAPAAPTDAGRRLSRCKGCSCSPGCYNYATSVRGAPCPACKAEMATEVQLVEPDGGAAAAAAAAGGQGSSGSVGYVRDMLTYTVMEDLTVAPMSTICAVTALAALGVTDITSLQAKTVEIGYKEGLALLKASLQSETVLTDVFLGGNRAVVQELLIWDLGAPIDSGTLNFWAPRSTTAE